MILISLHFPYYCSVQLNFPFSKVSENMLYILQCIPFSSVLTLLPRNKNKPDIRGICSSLMGQSFYHSRNYNLKEMPLINLPPDRCHEKQPSQYSYVAIYLQLKWPTHLQMKKHISTRFLSVIKVNVYITVKRRNQGWITSNSQISFRVNWPLPNGRKRFSAHKITYVYVIMKANPSLW